jgi:hypothetical protein
MGVLMNGDARTQGWQPQAAPSVPQPMGQDTPLAYYTPIAITPATLRWIAVTVVSACVALSGIPAAERYLNPAKQEDMTVVQQSMKAINDEVAGLKRSTDSLMLTTERLTTALGGINDAVDGLRLAIDSMPDPLAAPAPAPRVRTAKRPAPVRKPAAPVAP